MGLLNTKAALAALALGLLAQPPAMAALTTGDSLDPSLPSLVVDTYTGLQWLSPYATRNHSYNDAYVRGLVGQYGLRYATSDEALHLINSNFGSPTTVAPGDAAGFQAAQGSFGAFGADMRPVGCAVGPTYSTSCAITLGITSTPRPSIPGQFITPSMWQIGGSAWLEVGALTVHDQVPYIVGPANPPIRCPATTFE